VPQLNIETAPQSVPARILVVEDEPLIRFAMAETLRDFGVSVWKRHQPTRLGNI
jgi:CheY-like chemotaxis protein